MAFMAVLFSLQVPAETGVEGRTFQPSQRCTLGEFEKWLVWRVCVCVCNHASTCVSVVCVFVQERVRRRGTWGAPNEAINKIIFYPAKEITAWHSTTSPSVQPPLLLTSHFNLRKTHTTAPMQQEHRERLFKKEAGC